jgi:hypothetical protein
MARRAVSVTLETDNVTWLKGRAGAAGKSVSELLDQIVTAARQGGRIGPVRSVAGTIDIDSSDPLLERADAVVRSAFDASLGRPLIARASGPAETHPAPPGARWKASRKRRG